MKACTVLVCVSFTEEMEGAFLDAAKRGDLPKVKELLAKGCPANDKTEVKYTHLSVYIAIVRHVSIV